MPQRTHASQASTDSPHPATATAVGAARRMRPLPSSLARAGLLGVLSLSLVLPACGKRPDEAPADVEAAAEQSALMAPERVAAKAEVATAGGAAQDRTSAARSTAADGNAGDASVPQKRYVAVRHALQIEAPGAEVANAWASVRDACARLDCELIASELQRETAQVPVSASLTLRVAPKDYAALTQSMGGQAKIVNDSASSEDKTMQVIDVEAHIKNRSDYRDSLRELLAEKGVKRTLSELFEIRDTLSQVQAEIDSALTRRKLLEQETSKEFVQMQFTAERGSATPTQYNPWRGLWRDALALMLESARALVQVTAIVLPWLLLVPVLMWPLRAWLRRRAERRAARQRARAEAAAAEANAARAALIRSEAGASID